MHIDESIEWVFVTAGECVAEVRSRWVIAYRSSIGVGHEAWAADALEARKRGKQSNMEATHPSQRNAHNTKICYLGLVSQDQKTDEIVQSNQKHALSSDTHTYAHRTNGPPWERVLALGPTHIIIYIYTHQKSVRS